VTDDPSQRLGDLIRRQRELSEMSMRQLANMAGISNPYLSQIERGLREPSEKVLEAIADQLELSVHTMYQQAGVDPDAEAEDPGTREAIRSDPLLTARQKTALVKVYDAFLEANGERRAARGGRRTSKS
jgi:transcriptional regulator with XRE-family HTH domain